MGLETVKEEVLSSAKEQEAALISEARKEAARILRETEAKIRAAKEKSDIEVKKATDTIKRQAIASGELEGKKMLLEAKKQVIESVFDEATKKLESLEDKKREVHIKKLLEKAKNDIEIAYAYCNRKDAKFLKGFDIQATGMLGGLMAEKP